MRNSIKTTLLMTCFCLLAGTGYSQFSLGVKGGMLQTKQHYSGGLDSINSYVNSRQGLVGGLVAEIRFNKGFAFQPELLYAQRGSKYEYGIPGFSILQRTRINYLDVPLLLKAGFEAGPIRFDILAGPSWSYALNGEVYTKAVVPILGTTEQTDAIDFEANSDVKRSEWGALAGLNVSVGMGSSRFFFDGRYLYGITNTSESSDAGNDYEAKNRGTAFTAGILMGF